MFAKLKVLKPRKTRNAKSENLNPKALCKFGVGYRFESTQRPGVSCNPDRPYLIEPSESQLLYMDPILGVPCYNFSRPK